MGFRAWVSKAHDSDNTPLPSGDLHLKRRGWQRPMAIRDPAGRNEVKSVNDDFGVALIGDRRRVGLHLPLVAVDPGGETLRAESLAVDLGAVDGEPDGPRQGVGHGVAAVVAGVLAHVRGVWPVWT